MRDWEIQVEGIKKVKETLEIYIDSLVTMNAAGSALSESISQHFSYISNNTSTANTPNTSNNDTQQTYAQNSPYFQVSNLYNNINNDIITCIQPIIIESIRNKCILPLNNILSNTSLVQDKLYIRKNLLIDRDVYKTKVDKDNNSKNINVTELQRHTSKLAYFSLELERIQTLLEDLFDEFDDAMPMLFGNELSSLIATLYYYTSSSSVLYSQLLPFIPQTQSTLCLLSMSTSAYSKFLVSPEIR